MEQTVNRAGRRAGWSDQETKLLWEIADEALGQGLPLKAAFDRIATETGRRPNSIRNFYYAQVRLRDDGKEHTARFVPFEEDEVRRLMEHVLRDKAQGHSVRSSLQKLSGGDHSLMLRYQNKYRSIVKTRPELVREIVDKLRAEGIEAQQPEVGHRQRLSLSDACQHLTEGARQTGENELVQACETFARLMLEGKSDTPDNRSVRMDLYRMALDEKQQSLAKLSDAAQDVLSLIKDFLAVTPEERESTLDNFTRDISGKIGVLEESLCV